MTDFETQSKAIAEKYPNLFSEIGRPWVGIGWLNLIDEMSKEISEQFPDVVYLQIKEKFGTLRVYCCCHSEALQNLIGIYEARSSIICEECGADGKVVNRNGWLKTCCETHL